MNVQRHRSTVYFVFEETRWTRRVVIECSPYRWVDLLTGNDRQVFCPTLIVNVVEEKPYRLRTFAISLWRPAAGYDAIRTRTYPPVASGVAA